jgi:hypothetical protein
VAVSDVAAASAQRISPCRASVDHPASEVAFEQFSHPLASAVSETNQGEMREWQDARTRVQGAHELHEEVGVKHEPDRAWTAEKECGCSCN